MEEILQIIKERGGKKKIFLSDLKSFFNDKKKAEEILKKKNPLIYQVDFIEEDEISYAITFINPGKIGKENYMTKGHYHIKSVPEVYYLLKGEGEILLKKGKIRKKIKLKKNIFYHIPKGYAHRTVNTGKKELSFLTIYQTDAGHDYKKIEKEGFR
jgi:glucose-6-phosphate isomerase, archaeal